MNLLFILYLPLSVLATLDLTKRTCDSCTLDWTEGIALVALETNRMDENEPTESILLLLSSSLDSLLFQNLLEAMATTSVTNHYAHTVCVLTVLYHAV